MNQPTTFQPTIVTDFNNFLSYCEKAKPSISKTREFISRKAAFEINQLLTNSHEGLTNRNDQHHYAQVHLFYHLGLSGDLFFLDWSKKSKPCFAPNSEQIERFRSLNTTEQYLFLFQCFYVYSNFDLISQEERRNFVAESVDTELQKLSQIEANKPYGITRHSTTKEQLDIDFGALLTDPSYLLYGEYFELWNIEKFDKKGDFVTRTFFIANTITLTSFGKNLIDFLVKNALFSLWNEPSRQGNGDPSPLGILFDEKIYEYYEADKDTKPLFEKMEAQYKPFFSVMKPFFGESVQAGFEVKIPKAVIKGNFTLEVTMAYFKPKVTRTIQLGNHLTLEDLHYAIIGSVDFDDDHLYAFYMDKSRKNGYGRMYEYGEPPFASAFKLADLNLAINKRFYYTFDFGDNWEFTITTKKFEETEKPLNKPKLIAQKGESPEQYPSWEEE